MFQNQEEGEMIYLKLLVGYGYPRQSQVQSQEGRNGNSRDKNHKVIEEEKSQDKFLE